MDDWQQYHYEERENYILSNNELQDAIEQTYKMTKEIEDGSQICVVLYNHLAKLLTEQANRAEIVNGEN